jgi:hypothetical protein
MNPLKPKFRLLISYVGWYEDKLIDLYHSWPRMFLADEAIFGKLTQKEQMEIFILIDDRVESSLAGIANKVDRPPLDDQKRKNIKYNSYNFEELFSLFGNDLEKLSKFQSGIINFPEAKKAEEFIKEKLKGFTPNVIYYHRQSQYFVELFPKAFVFHFDASPISNEKCISSFWLSNDPVGTNGILANPKIKNFIIPMPEKIKFYMVLKILKMKIMVKTFNSDTVKFLRLRLKTLVCGKKLLLFPTGWYGYTNLKDAKKGLNELIENAANKINPKKFNIMVTMHPAYIELYNIKLQNKYKHIVINELSYKQSLQLLPYVDGILSNGSGVGIQGKLLLGKPLFVDDVRSASCNLADGDFTSINTFFKNKMRPKDLTNVLYFLIKYVFLPRIFESDPLIWCNYLQEKINYLENGVSQDSMEFYSTPILSNSQIIETLFRERYKKFKPISYQKPNGEV